MFVKNEAAMKVGNYLVVADVHVGMTKDLWQAGVTIPSQVKSLAKRLNRLRRITRTKYLIINGDLKHKVTGISMQERREVPEFIGLLKFQKVIIVKGNHDGDLEKLVVGLKGVSVKKSFAVGDYFFTHGHRTVSTGKKIIVVGHNHMSVKFRDQMGAIYIEPVWVRGKAGDKTIIIMPAFNELCGSFSVNRGKFRRPVASQLKNPHVYLLDGTDIGKAKDL